MSEMPKKRCPKCGEHKALMFFTPSSQKRSGTECMMCANAKRKRLAAEVRGTTWRRSQVLPGAER
jgi:hypothetical protein